MLGKQNPSERLMSVKELASVALEHNLVDEDEIGSQVFASTFANDELNEGANGGGEIAA